MPMILFLADNHYGKSPGRNLYESLCNDFDFDFFEDDLNPLCNAITDYSLLILNLIPDTPGSAKPDANMTRNLKIYLESGKPLLLLHGSSATLPEEEWWRDLVGLRWVRGDDPWHVDASTHPNDPFRVRKTKNSHALCERLTEFDADDELYINLELTSPILTLMESDWNGRSWPQCYVKSTVWGGKLCSFIPGHSKRVVKSNAVTHNVGELIKWCLEK